ncbi:MAG: Gfo/Idh/MocA family protein, partial [Chitinophagales bacterium]
MGLGQIGKRHAQIIHDHPQAQLVGIADVDSSLRQIAEEKFNAQFFSSADQLFASTQTDVSVIATPNGLHAEQAIAALERGCHVVIEKPMGLTKAECELMIHKALQKSRLVFCVMQNRYSPPSQWLKEIVSQNVLGRIFMVEINCFWNRDDRYYKPDNKSEKNWKGSKALDGGPLFTQFSHFVDMMYWLFGDIKNLQVRTTNFSHKISTEFNDDCGFITFEFLSGALGSFNYSTGVWDKNFESSMTIIAENGTVKVGGQYMEHVEYCHVKNYSMPELPSSNPPNEYGTH